MSRELWTDDRIGHLRRLAGMGYGTARIADLLGGSVSSIRRAAYRFGIAISGVNDGDSPYFDPREVDCWLIKGYTKYMTTAQHERYLPKG